jgi:integrase
MAIRKEMRQKGKRGVWYAMTSCRGVKLEDCLDTTDDRIATQRLAELKFKVERGEYQKDKIPFLECAEKWKRLEQPKKSKKEGVRQESDLNTHLIPYFGKHKIGQIINFDTVTGSSMVTEFFASKKHLPESSLKKMARVLKGVIRQADKTFEIPPVIYLNEGFYQTKFMRQDELDSAIGFLNEQHQAIAMLMAYTGLTLGDALGLRWGNVDLQLGMIRTKRGKTGTLVNMGICEPLMDLLKFKARVRNLHDDRIFKIGIQGFQKCWRKAVVKAGISWKPRPTDLRHFFASTMLNRGEDSLVVANLMGHTSVAMLHKRYGHFGDERLKKAVSVFDHKPGELRQINANSRNGK